ELGWAQRLTASDCAASQQPKHLTAVGAEQELQRPANIVLCCAPFFDTAKQQAKILHLQEDVGDLSRRRVTISADSEPDVCSPKRRTIVDAVAQHCHDRAGALQGTHDLQLLCRTDTGEDIDRRGAIRPLARLQPVELVSRKHAQIATISESNLGRDGTSRNRCITGQYDRPYTCFL